LSYNLSRIHGQGLNSRCGGQIAINEFESRPIMPELNYVTDGDLDHMHEVLFVKRELSNRGRNYPQCQ
jgi:hypothetical protein